MRAIPKDTDVGDTHYTHTPKARASAYAQLECRAEAKLEPHLPHPIQP